MAEDREEAIKRLSERRAQEFKDAETDETDENAEDSAPPPAPEPIPEEADPPPAAEAEPRVPEEPDDLQRRLNEIAALDAQQSLRQEDDSLSDLERQYLEAVNEGEFEEAFRIQKQYNQADRQRIMRDVEFQIDQREAVTNFKRDYGDIYEDPYLFKIANQQIMEMTAKGVSIVEAAELAGRSVNQWLEKKAGHAAGEEAPPPRQARHERKRRTVIDMPVSTNTRGTSAPAKAEPTTADVIQQMKLARGQS